MKVVFTGTCAADFSPQLNTNFKNSFDKNVRRSSGLLINGHIQIDCGPHTVGALKILNVPLSDITDILITHLHSDHFMPDEVKKLLLQNELYRYVFGFTKMQFLKYHFLNVK